MVRVVPKFYRNVVLRVVSKYTYLYTLLFIYNHIFYIYCYLHRIKDLFFVTNTNYVFGRRQTLSA